MGMFIRIGNRTYNKASIAEIHKEDHPFTKGGGCFEPPLTQHCDYRIYVTFKNPRHGAVYYSYIDDEDGRDAAYEKIMDEL